jgi:polyisoprenoid-binding protein YceI
MFGMFSKRVGLGMATALFAGVLTANATEYKIDMAHTELLFKVRHMGISTVTGRFDSLEGSFNVDPKNLKATTGWATIYVNTINTNNEKRDNHLKSDDFFNAAEYPTIKFKSKSVQNINMKDTTCDLVGDLTIRNVTQEITLKIKGEGIANDGYGNDHIAFGATGTLNRFDYGLKWNKLLEAGSLVVGQDVQLDLSFEGLHSTK